MGLTYPSIEFLADSKLLVNGFCSILYDMKSQQTTTLFEQPIFHTINHMSCSGGRVAALVSPPLNTTQLQVWDIETNTLVSSNKLYNSLNSIQLCDNLIYLGSNPTISRTSVLVYDIRCLDQVQGSYQCKWILSETPIENDRPLSTVLAVITQLLRELWRGELCLCSIVIPP